VKEEAHLGEWHEQFDGMMFHVPNQFETGGMREDPAAEVSASAR
jgi:hypothetical protein